jgi:hypothetical protein
MALVEASDLLSKATTIVYPFYWITTQQIAVGRDILRLGEGRDAVLA